jgi:hypothetical protein
MHNLKSITKFEINNNLHPSYNNKLKSRQIISIQECSSHPDLIVSYEIDYN